MSNLWKAYGLATVSQEFGVEIRNLSILVNDLTGDPTLNETEKFLRAIDPIQTALLKFRCTLGHVDFQVFHDSLFNTTEFWDLLGIVQSKGVFDPAPKDQPLIFDEYCRVIGLATTDPFLGSQFPAARGFRHDLRDDARAGVSRRGFILADDLADRLSTGLTKPVEVGGRQLTVIDVFDRTAQFWEDVTLSNVTDRVSYGRLTNFPKGWVKR